MIPPLCNLLNVSDAKVITVALEGLENILRIAQGANLLERIVEIVHDCGGLASIENLQEHDNAQVSVSGVFVMCFIMLRLLKVSVLGVILNSMFFWAKNSIYFTIASHFCGLGLTDVLTPLTLLSDLPPRSTSAL